MAMRADLPRHAPVRRLSLDSAFASRVLGKREAARLAGLMADAERRARERMEAAAREAEQIFAHARAEAEAILAMLPDFAALEATRDGSGRSAYHIIRKVADRHGLPIAALTARQKNGSAPLVVRQARDEAIVAIAAACNHLDAAHVGALFGIGGSTVVNIVRERS